MTSKKFHVDNHVIITTKDKVDVEEIFNHLKSNLNNYREGSQFILLGGFHTYRSGEMGAIDHDLTIDYQEMFERFHGRPKRYTELAKIVEERKFQMGTVIPLSSNKDYSQEDAYTLSNQSKSQIKMLFEDVLSKKRPIVLILASCWSYRSLIEEHGNITCGKFIQLDDKQQEFLKIVVNDLTKKDVIVGGE